MKLQLSHNPASAISLPGRRATFVAGFRRESRSLVRNRFLQVFALLSISGGILAVTLRLSVEATPYLLLQAVLFLAPLFAVLIGVSSAHEESEEREFLFSQPVSRLSLVLGKGSALWAAFLFLLAAAFLPGAVAGGGAVLFLLAFWSFLVGGVFLMLGLAVGFSTMDRARGLIYALVLWLLIVFGHDLVAYTAAALPLVQNYPLAWLAILLVNPVDALRIATLFQLEEIPFHLPAESAWAARWIDHLGLWVIAVSLLWMAALTAWIHRQVERGYSR